MLTRCVKTCIFGLWLSQVGAGVATAATTAAPEVKPYQTSKLTTGLELIGMESHKVPLATIVLSCKAGAMTETADINGLTHLWEHMFFKGNQRLQNQEVFNKRIRQLGIEFNGDTAAEKVRYFFTLPSAFLEDGVQFMADAIATPLLEQKEMERERRVVLNEYERAAAQPSFDFANLQRYLVYGEQEYLRDPLGKRPTIETATREQLLRIKREVFVPKNCALLVAGDFKPQNLQELAQKYFGDWQTPPGWQAVKPAPFPKFPSTQSYVMARMNVQNAQIGLSFAGPLARSQPKDSYAADVLIGLLDHRSGKFYKKFIDSGLAYEAGLSYYTESQAGEIELYANAEPAKAKEIEALLLAETKEWAKPNYFDKTQLEDVRRKLSITHKRELNQPTEYIKSLAFWWAVTGLDYYDSYITNMRQVSLEDVRRFAAKWLVGKPYVGGILLSPQDGKAVGLVDTAQPLVSKYLKAYAAKAPQPSLSK